VEPGFLRRNAKIQTDFPKIGKLQRKANEPKPASAELRIWNLDHGCLVWFTLDPTHKPFILEAVSVVSSLNESAAGHNVTSHRHEGEPRRGRRDVGIRVAVGISMVALAAGTPTRVLGGQPSKVSRAQHATSILFLLPKLQVEAAERTKLFWFVGAPRQQEIAVAALSKVKPAAMAGPRLQKVEDGPRQDTFVMPASPPPQRPSAPALAAPLALNAEAAVATRFDVSVGGNPEDLRPGTVVRVSGLPRGATLSGGQANADRGWVVPLWTLDDLKIRVSSETSGELDLVVALVDNNGVVLDERVTTVHVQPATVAAPSRSETDLNLQQEKQEAAVTVTPPQRPPAAALVVPATLNAEAAVATRFDVSVGGRPEDLRPGTVVRVSGLPRGATLSGGQANADRGWVVPLWALDDLKITVSSETSGELDLVVALVDNNGTTLAERSVALRIDPRVAGVPRDLASPSKTTVAAPAPIEASRGVLRAKGNGLPVSSAPRHSALKLRLKKPLGTTSDTASGRDNLKTSRVTDARNTKSGPCLLEWRFYSPKVLWHIGECRDATGR
jgi:hypothetical protein